MPRSRAAAGASSAADATDASLELQFVPDPSIWDGRYANNAWLQELPKPLTKLTWDNAVLIAPALAQRLGLANEDVVELDNRGAKVEAPVWIMPGHADGAVSVSLGYGRTRAGRVGDGHGFDAYALRTADSPWFARGLTLRRTGKTYALATTQSHHSMEGRDLVRVATLAQFARDPQAATAPERSTFPDRLALWLPAPERRLQVGNGDRPRRVHRLQRLHDRLPGGKQHSDGRQGGGCARPRNALDSRRPLLRRHAGSASNVVPAGALHAMRARALRARVPGRSVGARCAGTERAGLQPLRRDAVLLQQLPLQGSPLQLPPVRRRRHPRVSRPSAIRR